MTKWRVLFASGLILSLALGCGPRNQRAAPGDEGVPIGVVFSLTGPAATYGQECLNGLQLAIDTANSKGGSQIKLIVLDDGGESRETVNSITQLIEVDKAMCVVGAVASTNTLAGAKVAQQSQTPMLVPISTNADITKTGDYISRICFNDPFQGKVLAKFAIAELKAGSAAIVTDKANDYSIGLAAAFRDTFLALGGKIAGESSYSAGDADFAALTAEVRSFNPDVIFIPGQYSDVGVMLKQSKEAWDGIPKLGGDGWDSPSLVELAGPAAYGCFISSHFASDDPSPKVQSFVSMYKERHEGQTPGAMACLGYDAGNILAAAVASLDKQLSRETLNQKLRATKDVEGVSGMISIDATGDAVKDAVILEVAAEGMKFHARVKP